MKKFEKLPAWQLNNVKSEKRSFCKHKEREKTVHLATPMDICHLKNAR